MPPNWPKNLHIFVATIDLRSVFVDPTTIEEQSYVPTTIIERMKNKPTYINQSTKNLDVSIHLPMPNAVSFFFSTTSMWSKASSHVLTLRQSHLEEFFTISPYYSFSAALCIYFFVLMMTMPTTTGSESGGDDE